MVLEKYHVPLYRKQHSSMTHMLQNCCKNVLFEAELRHLCYTRWGWITLGCSDYQHSLQNLHQTYGGENKDANILLGRPVCQYFRGSGEGLKIVRSQLCEHSNEKITQFGDPTLYKCLQTLETCCPWLQYWYIGRIPQYMPLFYCTHGRRACEGMNLKFSITTSERFAFGHAYGLVRRKLKKKILHEIISGSWRYLVLNAVTIALTSAEMEKWDRCSIAEQYMSR